MKLLCGLCANQATTMKQHFAVRGEPVDWHVVKDYLKACLHGGWIK